MAGINFVKMPRHRVLDSFADAVRRGLALPQPSIPSRFLYDRRGSELFEAITALPAYYLTRAERDIFCADAAEIVRAAGPDSALIEFGSGSSAKTRLLIEAALEGRDRLHYVPIDISHDSLAASAAELCEAYPGLAITAFAAEYNDAIPLLPRHHAARLLLFLGSNIGNFGEREAVEFLGRVRRHMEPADRLLVGFDLVKDPDLLRLAYDDPEGVTREFNKNVLARINRELGGEFDLDAFDHAAPLLDDPVRIEMRLVSNRAQTVRIAALEAEYRFEPGDYIHTENSHKYTGASFERLARQAGLAPARTWHDERRRFAVQLLEPGA